MSTTRRSVHLENGGDEAVEGAAGHLHSLARLIWARRTDDGAVLLTRLESFDGQGSSGGRRSTPVCAHRRLRDRPPELKVRVHAHEQISGEERPQE